MITLLYVCTSSSEHRTPKLPKNYLALWRKCIGGGTWCVALRALLVRSRGRVVVLVWLPLVWLCVWLCGCGLSVFLLGETKPSPLRRLGRAHLGGVPERYPNRGDLEQAVRGSLMLPDCKGPEDPSCGSVLHAAGRFPENP